MSPIRTPDKLPWILGALFLVMLAALTWRVISSRGPGEEVRRVVRLPATGRVEAPKARGPWHTRSTDTSPPPAYGTHVEIEEFPEAVDARVVQPSPPFDEAALAAVREWTFKPALSHGRPVAVWVAVPVRFTLR